jgi:cell division protease FtsH
MSETIGPLAVIARDGQSGPLFPGASEVSDDTQRLVDQEVRRIVDEAHQRVSDLLQRERERLDSLAAALLEHETLDQDDAYAAARVEPSRPAEGPKAREAAAAAAARVVHSDG